MEIAAINAEAARLCEGLGEQQLAWRPAPNQWSIAENLVHLNLTTQTFLPSVERAIGKARPTGATGPFELGLKGALFIWYTEPPPKFRVPAPKMIRPLLQGPANEALPQFLRSQEAALRKVDAARGLDCANVRFRSPLSSIVSMNLITFFAVLTGHQRRHLWQARNVREALRAAG